MYKFVLFFFCSSLFFTTFLQIYSLHINQCVLSTAVTKCHRSLNENSSKLFKFVSKKYAVAFDILCMYNTL